jgi:hypothetical protein
VGNLQFVGAAKVGNGLSDQIYPLTPEDKKSDNDNLGIGKYGMADIPLFVHWCVCMMKALLVSRK